MSTPSERRQAIDEWVARTERRAQAYRDLAAEITTIAATAASPRGVARVTTDQAGLVTGIQILDAHRQLSGDELAREIMTAMRSAQSRVQQQVLDRVREHLADDPEAAASVADQYRRRFGAEGAPRQQNGPARSDADDEGFGSVFDN